ncbi:hypothetical protein VTO73DRAFT_5334 [Trametes versicolor]
MFKHYVDRPASETIGQVDLACLAEILGYDNDLAFGYPGHRSLLAPSDARHWTLQGTSRRVLSVPRH